MTDDGKRGGGEVLPQTLLSDGLGLRRRWRVIKAVREFATLPVPHGLWTGGWQS